jgi:hypothetical protein
VEVWYKIYIVIILKAPALLKARLSAGEHLSGEEVWPGMSLVVATSTTPGAVVADVVITAVIAVEVMVEVIMVAIIKVRPTSMKH